MSQAILDENSNWPQAEIAIVPKQRALAENFETSNPKEYVLFTAPNTCARVPTIALEEIGRIAQRPSVQRALRREEADKDTLEAEGLLFVPPPPPIQATENR